MKGALRFLLPLLSLAACKIDSTTGVHQSIPSGATAVHLMRASDERIMSGQEEALIERIVARLPTESKARVRGYLRSPFASVGASENVAIGTLLDSLLSLRLHAGNSIVNGGAQGDTDESPKVSAAIALVGSLDDSRAGAIILRRARLSPHDLILVTKSTTNADMRNAIAALFVARARGGDSPAVDERIRVAVPARQLNAKRRDILIESPISWNELERGAPQLIAGVGVGRLLLIQLSAAGSLR